MRVSIITGGGSGIGAAVARRLAARDECLMLHGQGADPAGLERLKAVALELSTRRRPCRVVHRRPRQCRNGIRACSRDARGVRQCRRDRPCRRVCRSARFRAVAARGARTGIRRHGRGVSRIGGRRVAGSDARIARTRRRHLQFRGPSVHARGDISGICGGQGRARGAGALPCDRARKLWRNGQCRHARLHPQGRRATRGVGPTDLAIGRQGQSAANDWPNRTRWRRWSPFCCRRRLDM